MLDLLKDPTISTLVGATALGVVTLATGGTFLAVLGGMIFGGGMTNLATSFGGK